MAVQLIPAGLLALMIPILKESPTWLLKRGREEEAYKVYSFLRMLVDYIGRNLPVLDALGLWSFCGYERVAVDLCRYARAT
jgi:hypothetical protein